MPPAPRINVSELHAKLKQPRFGLKPVAAPPLLIDELRDAITKRKARRRVRGGVNHHRKHVNHNSHVDNSTFSFSGAAQVQAGSGRFQFQTAASALAPAAPAHAAPALAPAAAPALAPAAPALGAELSFSAICRRLERLEKQVQSMIELFEERQEEVLAVDEA